MSEIKITHAPVPPTPKKEEPGMYAGRFYVRKDRDDAAQLVFVASEDGAGERLKSAGWGPQADTPVVAIGSGLNGYALRGLFAGEDAYEEVDVEITVRRRPQP